MLVKQQDNKSKVCINIFTDKRVLILGMGRTGLSCLRFLVDRNVNVAISDSRDMPPELSVIREQYPDVAVFIGGFDTQAIENADILVVSPGISVTDLKQQYPVVEQKQIVGDVEIFAQCTTKPIIAITGSNGKSTVTSLVSEMARMAKSDVAVGGNIGVPVLDLLEWDDLTDAYVLELSSFQLETTYSLRPAVSVILNISEDHMDRYDGMADYHLAKHRIFAGAHKVVCNLAARRGFSD